MFKKIKIQKLNKIKPFLVGICMGIADLIPGVSGGTIALLGGIYEKLIQSISNIKNSIVMLYTSGLRIKTIKKIWKKINGSFLVLVFGGIIISALLGSRFLELLLEKYPIYIGLFFVGLILASSILLYFQYQIHKDKNINYSSQILLFILGGVFGLSISIGNIGILSPTGIGFLIAGVLGSIAMILPGISGSYILLLAGIYTPVISTISGVSNAISNGDLHTMMTFLPDLGLFSLGILVGLLTISSILKRLLTKRHNQTLLFLIGCMLGALPAIIPGWNEIIVGGFISLGSFLLGAIIITLVIYPTLKSNNG